MSNVTKLYATILTVTLAATTSGCGSVGLKQGGEKESKGAKANATSTTPQGASGKGVRFALGLPAKFEDDGKGEKGEGGGGKESGDELLVDESDMKDEFAETLASERIIVTCDGEPMKDYDKIKGKALRGIFELTLIGNSAKHPPVEPKPSEEPSEKPYQKPSEKEGYGLKKQAAKEPQDEGKDVDGNDVDLEEKEWSEEPAEAPGAPKHDFFEDMIVEHLAVPFVCPANATVEIVDLAAGYDYHIEANLYSAAGALRYSGMTPSFTAGEAKAVDLVMSPVQSTGVSINVIFADGETKKADGESKKVSKK